MWMLELILADQLADLPPWYWHLVVRNGNFTFLLLELILADEEADLPSQNWHLVVKNGNFKSLLLEFILADQLAHLPCQLLASHGQEWQFSISTVRVHIGRPTSRSTPLY